MQRAISFKACVRCGVWPTASAQIVRSAQPSGSGSSSRRPTTSCGSLRSSGMEGRHSCARARRAGPHRSARRRSSAAALSLGSLFWGAEQPLVSALRGRADTARRPDHARAARCTGRPAGVTDRRGATGGQKTLGVAPQACLSGRRGYLRSMRRADAMAGGRDFFRRDCETHGGPWARATSTSEHRGEARAGAVSVLVHLTRGIAVAMRCARAVVRARSGEGRCEEQSQRFTAW